MLIFVEESDLSQLTSNIEVRNLNSNEVTRLVNQMEGYLIRFENSHLDKRVELGHVNPLVE